MATTVKAHILRDYDKHHGPAGDQFGAEGVAEERLHNAVAFTSLLYNQADGLVYCGITAYDADIFYTFNPQTGEFTSLGWAEVGEKYDVKVHRSLCMDNDGVLYGATACLHDVTQRLKAPGGKLFSYDPATGELKLLCTPIEYDYIQTITLDPERMLLYGQTYPVANFFKYDIAENEVTNFSYIGSSTHISALDDNGCFWGCYRLRGNYLFSYDPDADEITWFDHGLPNDAAVDGMINGGDGYIYVGSTGGELIRLDPATAECEYLGKPYPEGRMPGLTVGDDGLIYGSAGNAREADMAKLFCYDREERSFTHLANLYDAELDTGCYYSHDITALDDSTFYIAETDNPARSGYLWECRLDT